MSQLTKGVAAVALITAATLSSQAWGWGNINTKLDFSKQDQRRFDHSTRIGGDVNRNDNRQWNDNRVTNTSDNRDMSDNRQWNDNRQDHQRHQSHNVGDNSIMINGPYQARAGHEKVEVGGMKGDYNMIDNSINGNNFGIGHTTVKP